MYETSVYEVSIKMLHTKTLRFPASIKKSFISSIQGTWRRNLNIMCCADNVIKKRSNVENVRSTGPCTGMELERWSASRSINASVKLGTLEQFAPHPRRRVVRTLVNLYFQKA